MAEKILMKGNEAIAHGAIRCGADGYFGYPITPQSEVMETLMEEKPWETTGMVVLQAPSSERTYLSAAVAKAQVLVKNENQPPRNPPRMRR